MKGFIVSCVISQPAPTFCIHVPVYEMTDAIHSDRNSGSPNGAQAETERFAAIDSTTGMLIISDIVLSDGEPGCRSALAAGSFVFAQGRLARRPSLHER